MSKICQFIQLVLLNETRVEFHLDYNGIIDGIIAIKRVKGREILLCTTVLTLYTTLYNRACQTHFSISQARQSLYITDYPSKLNSKVFAKSVIPIWQSISRQEIDFQIT